MSDVIKRVQTYEYKVIEGNIFWLQERIDMFAEVGYEVTHFEPIGEYEADADVTEQHYAVVMQRLYRADEVQGC